ncbi:unnamed protein product [Cuscuta campestris]|uniref:Uncharacterized protein n=1 Tax=Cuscuta campestris TaxID=132261 RepID=A0A484NBB8_9ASTE|nr:unnamed protein product [Cuscuta campestris]
MSVRKDTLFGLCNGSSLRRFSLGCDILEDAPLIIAWISFALLLKVEVLKLHLQKPSSPYDTCWISSSENIHISAPKLQFLCIDETIDDEDIDYDEVGFSFQDALSYDRQLHISRASLRSFMYNGELINN